MMNYVAKENVKVAPVIVTYSDRLKYVFLVLDRLKEIGVFKSIVVLNGVLSSADKIQKLKQDTFVEVVELNSNTGSAGGYFHGIDHALSMNIDFVWLLDDDNLPDRKALDILLDGYKTLSPSNYVLSCRREDRPNQIKAYRKGKSLRYYRNGFLGTSISQFLPGRKRNKNIKDKQLLRCDIGPYGGLLLHKTVIETIGLPLKSFFTYGDDYEYTLRLAKHNIKLFIAIESFITDIEHSWHCNDTGSSFFDPKHRNRIYYTIRNGTYLDYLYVTNKLVRFLNIIFFFFGQCIKDLLNLKTNFLNFSQWKLIFNAISSGRKGITGKINER